MLTPTELESFHRDGYLRIRQVVAGQELARLQQVSAAVVADGLARRGDHHLYRAGAGGETVYWRSERMWRRDAVFRSVSVHPDLLENVAQCIGRPCFPWNDSLVVKVAGEGAPVQWHQDPPYSSKARTATHPIPNFTCDIYLDASTTDNGCVWAVPGWHRRGHVAIGDRSDSDWFSHPDAIPIEMEPGDVLFHWLSTPHGSRGNRSPRMRRTFYIHYLCEESYQEAYASSGQAWVADKPGWGEAMRLQMQAMVADRVAAGLESPLARRTLAFTDGGFAAIGVPMTTRSATAGG